MSPPHDYPSIPVSPRYLTGDGPALKEFVDKFDVRPIYSLRFATVDSLPAS
jgi:hypothetical protein